MVSRLILCCLGNPGERYSGTRHNLGFDLGDALVERAGGVWSRPREQLLMCRVGVAGADVTIVKPQTYMNLSGEALELLAEIEPVTASRTLVVCDDIALPLGVIRLRKQGSDGGHNGLRSIISSLNTRRFPRLRLGVGPVPEGADAADFVLEPMASEDAAVAARMLREAVKCVETALAGGIDTAMNRFNRRVGGGSTEEGVDETG
jgi:PTH1 family peptidyl-tRNA hydrolase